MLIIGAKGFAKEVLEVLYQNNQTENLAFYDDVNDDVSGLLYNQFPILKNEAQAKIYFETVDKNFTIGIGNPFLRKKLYEKFKNLGGNFASTISNFANIGHYNVGIDDGNNLLQNVIISNDVQIKKGCLIYYNTTITHDCTIDEFVEISPCVTILGNVKIEKYCQIGANTTILPKLTIGNNVIVGAGTVVTKNLPANCVAVGIPAKIIKYLEPLENAD